MFNPIKSILIGGILLTAPYTGHAEFSVQPSALAGQEYNDNFNLTIDPVPVWKTYFNGGVNTRIVQPEWQINLFGQYRGSRYLNETDLNADDGSLAFTSSYFTEYTQWGLIARATLDHPSSNQLQAGTQVFDRIQRLNWSVSPSFSWNTSEFTRLNLNYRYNDTKYGDSPNVPTSRSDFVTHTADIIYSYTIHENSQIFTQGSYTKTINDDVGFQTDQYSLQMGLEHSFSESLDVSFSAGIITLVTKLNNRRPLLESNITTDTGYILNFNLSKDFEYGQFSVTLNRNLAPTINGGQVELNSFESSYSHEILDELNLILGVSAIDSSSISGTFSQPGRENLVSRISLSWQFEENWLLESGYAYSLQKIDTKNESSDRNAVFLSLNYRWPDFFPLE